MPFKPCHSVVLILCLVLSQAAGAAVDTTKLTETVRQAKMIDASFPLEMRLNDKTLFVQTDRHPKATEHDCKIDAVLIGKEVFKAPELDSLVAIFKPRSESDTKEFWRVQLTRKHVEHFANGAMTKQALLDTIALEKREPRPDAPHRRPLPIWRLQQAAAQGDPMAAQELRRRMDHKFQMFTRRLEAPRPVDNVSSAHPETH